LFYTIIFSCGKSSNKQSSIEIIANNNKQDSIFRNLIHLTNNTISEDLLNDSLAFLILPVQASCPSCRNKTIDSIAKHKNSLVDHHFIIISAKGGHKTINSYFKENNKDLPVIENKLFLDSTNEARRHDLYDKKPTIYYTYKKKAYKKVSAIPASIRQDLQEFFSGYRNDHN
jgi:hypothetical protein